jgi:hypothetical protein
MTRITRITLLPLMLIAVVGAGIAHDRNLAAERINRTGDGIGPACRLVSSAGVEGDSIVIIPGQPLYLEPNIPNPFSTKTTIGYTLDRETPVTLAVYDQFYNLIEVLVDDEYQTEGRYEVEYNPKGALASGWYFYSLKTSAGVETRRMMHIH